MVLGLAIGLAVPALAGSMVAAAPASAATCHSPNFAWSSGTTVYPGQWCVTRYGFRLVFRSNGALALYDSNNVQKWGSGTAGYGMYLTFNMRGDVRIHGCTKTASGAADCSHPDTVIWDWGRQTDPSVAGDFNKFVIQIGEDLGSKNFLGPCWTVSGYDVKLGGWVNSGKSVPSDGGCADTYAMSGGAPGGDLFEPV